jgi:hypothetical protein
MTPKEARLFELAPKMERVLRAIVESGDPIPALGDEAVAVVHALDAPFCADTDPTWCSCPRYPNGGRKEPDPTCPLHAGDARD